MTKPNDHRPSPFLQFLVNFIIPIIILTRYSSDSQLGPIKGMLLALAFPVAYEMYNVYKRKKFSMLSAIAIGGILVTGAMSLLGLSEGWLALRRSLPYFAVGLAILISMWIKKPLVEKFLPQIIDMEKARDAAKEKKTTSALNNHIKLTTYLFAVTFIGIAVASFVLTRAVITHAAGTTGFNEEYARLRVLALPFNTLPLFVAFISIVMVLFTKIEKLTGLDIEVLVKKKK